MPAEYQEETAESLVAKIEDGDVIEVHMDDPILAEIYQVTQP